MCLADEGSLVFSTLKILPPQTEWLRDVDPDKSDLSMHDLSKNFNDRKSLFLEGSLLFCSESIGNSVMYKSIFSILYLK